MLVIPRHTPEVKVYVTASLELQITANRLFEQVPLNGKYSVGRAVTRKYAGILANTTALEETDPHHELPVVGETFRQLGENKQNEVSAGVEIRDDAIAWKSLSDGHVLELLGVSVQQTLQGESYAPSEAGDEGTYINLYIDVKVKNILLHYGVTEIGKDKRD